MLKEKDVLMQEVISLVFGAFATVILVKLSNSARLIFLSEHFSNSAAACVELSPSLAIGARVVTHAALILITARCSRHTQHFDARTWTTIVASAWPSGTASQSTTNQASWRRVSTRERDLGLWDAGHAIALWR